ncbi:MAG: Uncharacterized protein G01um101493_206 [Microgenomates group bacterium Gr01-1014_93]|nr:MAG: Uncharacterized protein G01um101493_206 [Microgenomates group bacterium Gr01-1014_93]
MNNLINTFLNNTYTTSDIKRRLVLLKAFIYSKFFGSQFNPEEFDQADQKWLQSLSEDFFKNFNQTNATMNLEKLDQELKKIPVLTIFIPFEMPLAQTMELGIWVKQNLGSDIIFETRIDPDLIGGSAFSWKGVSKDYSLRQTISERRNEILETFKGYVNV